MKAVKKTEGGNYLKWKYVEEEEITELKIVSEVIEVEFNKDGKVSKRYQADVEYEGQGKNDPLVWTLNAPSSNTLMDLISDDTDEWRDVNLPITIDGAGEFKHFKVDKVRLKKQLKND